LFDWGLIDYGLIDGEFMEANAAQGPNFTGRAI
jgi:hypothetical protein